jgi:predicted transcriptional regulator
MSMAPLPGGALERAVETVWQLEEAMAREVHDRIGVLNQLAYTTIAQVLDRLVANLWLPGALR